MQKEQGIGFNLRDGSAVVKANYWFPETSGTAGQIMTQSGTGNRIIWKDGTGLVNVSTASPASSVPITEYVGGGSSYIGDPHTGIILTSPDGGKFKITVNNDGSLNSTKVTVP